ncbi:DUF3667 domain-containing protein [Chitinophaga caeni]|nr:DUF3667 domain-containing protein [Chitinophaga caeni]
MSHQQLRPDPTCLNCGHHVPERYCTHCGQENIETKESFVHMVGHFVADVLHYDSKSLVTFKYLITQPGLLTKAYNQGQRMRYVNPIKLYIFISFVFFFLSFTFHASYGLKVQDEENSEKIEKMDGAMGKLSAGKDTLAQKDSMQIGDGKKSALFINGQLMTVAQYDSIQASKPERDGFLPRNLMRQYLYARHKYGDKATEVIGEKFNHNIPKLMFFLLPVFALLLKLFYDKKKWFYTQHGIFALHLHSFVFLYLTVTIIINQLTHTDIATGLLILIFPVYLVYGLKTAYDQSWFTSVLKGIFIYFIYLVIVLFSIVGYLGLTFSMI